MSPAAPASHRTAVAWAGSPHADVALATPPLNLAPDDRVLLLDVTHRCTPATTRADLHAMVQDWWAITPTRHDPRIVLASVDGIVCGAWRIDPDAWQRHPTQARSSCRAVDDATVASRFEGRSATALREPLAHDPVTWLGCGPTSPGCLHLPTSFLPMGTTVTSRCELAITLLGWLDECDEWTIGDLQHHPGDTPWVHLELGSRRFSVLAATTRAGVTRYVELVEQVGADHPWLVLGGAPQSPAEVVVCPSGRPVEGFHLTASQWAPGSHAIAV